MRNLGWIGLVLLGCSSTTPDGDGGSGTPATRVSVTLGPDGGEATSKDAHLSVDVPAGALTESVELTIEVADSAPTGGVGTAYEIGPSGLQFLKPVTLTFSYEDAWLEGTDEGSLAAATATGSSWELLTGRGVDTAANKAHGDTLHLSLFGLTTTTQNGTGGAGGTASSSNGGAGGEGSNAAGGLGGGSTTAVGAGGTGGASSSGSGGTGGEDATSGSGAASAGGFGGSTSSSAGGSGGAGGGDVVTACGYSGQIFLGICGEGTSCSQNVCVTDNACTEGLLDCNTTSNDACEINSDTNPYHCGQCGHACQTQGCQNGYCEPDFPECYGLECGIDITWTAYEGSPVTCGTCNLPEECTGEGKCIDPACLAEETCDGLDNDCDSSVDEGNPEGGASCSTGMATPCETGTVTCTGATLVCQADTTALEICGDSLDNNCNGAVDDNCGGDALWSVAFGSANNADAGYATAVDAQDNVYLAGAFSGTVNLGGGDITADANGNILVAKFSSDGTLAWTKTFGSTGADAATSIAVDATGNVYVGANFGGTVDFDTATLTAHWSDGVLLKLNASGAVQWAKQLAGSTNVDDPIRAVAATSGGNVAVIGTLGSAADLGGGTLTPTSSSDVYLAVYDTTGTHQWSNTWAARFNAGGDVTFDDSGNLLVTGGFYTSLNVGGSTLTASVSRDIFVAKFTSAGTHVWSKAFGGDYFSSTDVGTVITTDPDDNVFVAGVAYGNIDFGGGTVTGNNSGEGFTLALTADGTYRWERIAVQSGWLATPWAGQALSDGSVLIAGSFAKTGSSTATGMDFGGGVLNTAGGRDIFVARYDGDRSHVWSKALGGTSDDACFGVGVGTGLAALGGTFRGTVDFGDGDKVAAGLDDGVVTTLVP